MPLDGPRPQSDQPTELGDGLTVAHRRASALRFAIVCVCDEITRMVEQAEIELGPDIDIVPLETPHFDEPHAETLAYALPDLFMLFHAEFKLAAEHDVKRAAATVTQ